MESGTHGDGEEAFGEEDLALLVEWLRRRGAPEERAWIAARQLARRAGQLAHEQSTTPEEALRGLLGRVAQAGTDPGSSAS